MGNMSYCRFQNTLDDLRDCHEHMDDVDSHSLGSDEVAARRALIRICVEIASDYGGEVA